MSAERTPGAPLRYFVTEYDAQLEGMALMSGWKIEAQVTAATGRKFTPVTIAVCSDKADAHEIAELLSAAYASEPESGGAAR